MATLLLALLFQDPAHGPKIADVREPRGSVTVTRDQQAHEVRQIARRIVNGDVYDSDQVATGDGGSVDLIFADESRVSLEADTQVVIEQRNLRQSEGPRTIGRRIQILTGRVASDIVPNASVGTDFVTPAGTAAVRGTLTDVGVAGPTADAFFDMGNGQFLLNGGQGLFQMPAGTHAEFTVNPDGTVNITNLDLRAETGNPMFGQLGNTQVSIAPDGTLNLQQTPQGFQVVDSTGVQINQNGTMVEPQPGLLLGFNDQPLFPTDDPLVPSTEGGANPAGTEGALLDQTLGITDPFADTGGAAGIANMLATTAAGPVIVDDFNRGNSSTIGQSLIGPVWTEISPSEWSIFNGAAQGTSTAAGDTFLVLDIGNQSTFGFEAIFNGGSNVNNFVIDVNANSGPFALGSGLHTRVFPSGSIIIGNSGGAIDSIGFPGVPPNTDVLIRLTYDGSTLTSSVFNSGGSLLGTVSGGTSNEPGTGLNVGAQMSGPETVRVDEVRESP